MRGMEPPESHHRVSCASRPKLLTVPGQRLLGEGFSETPARPQSLRVPDACRHRRPLLLPASLPPLPLRYPRGLSGLSGLSPPPPLVFLSPPCFCPCRPQMVSCSIHSAVREGDVDAVLQWISDGADVDSLDDTCTPETPLFAAAYVALQGAVDAAMLHPVVAPALAAAATVLQLQVESLM